MIRLNLQGRPEGLDCLRDTPRFVMLHSGIEFRPEGLGDLGISFAVAFAVGATPQGQDKKEEPQAASQFTTSSDGGSCAPESAGSPGRNGSPFSGSCSEGSRSRSGNRIYSYSLRPPSLTNQAPDTSRLDHKITQGRHRPVND